MKLFVVVLLLGAGCSAAFTQHTFRAIMRDSDTQEPLVGASAVVKGMSIGTSSDGNGFVRIDNIPLGRHTIAFRLVGYKQHEQAFDFPLPSEARIDILLTANEEEMEEIVVVSTTRSSRTIADEPTRIEAITAEELSEKANMKPGDIRMLLFESPGIQTQQTSATTANASIRIQGLDGRYTQILKDGFPLYAGFAGGLSIMQIPPLDLRQVEVIKGSASTLYGGGAIAGIINLISRAPASSRDLDFHFNVTSAGGLDLSGYYSEGFDGFAFSLFASNNSNAAYDPANIGLTAIPELSRQTIAPRFFLTLSERTKLDVGCSIGLETRTGGNVDVVRSGQRSSSSYFERNESTRLATQFNVQHSLDEHSTLAVRNSVSSFTRGIESPLYEFDGSQLSTFSEASYTTRNERLEWIMGANVWTDDFVEGKTIVPRDYSHTIVGGFAQNTWNASDLLAVESGLRFDYAKNYGSFVLPRVSVLFKLSSELSSRIGGGVGYKLPTMFTEDVEEIQFRNVLPIDEANTDAERSVGGNVDVNYRTTLFDLVSFSVNQLFFYTKLDKPLLLSTAGAMLKFSNANGHIDTRGLETNIKLSHDHAKLFVGYTFTDARQHVNGTLVDVLLMPKHRVNCVLMYEVHDDWRAGLEAYFFDKQQLSDGTTGKSYWICGFMAEKSWERFSVYINCENVFDTRQTKFDRIFVGTVTRPQFRDIYAPVDGFVVNGGVKISL